MKDLLFVAMTCGLLGIIVNISERQAFKAKAHHLKPIVLIGSKGLTAAVIEEVNAALSAHELMKIKIANPEKEQRQSIAKEICEQLGAEFVQLIGNVVVIYRKRED